MAFEFSVRVYWEDTDAGGIVFYANYLKFFERARTEWLRSLGIEQQRLRDATGGMFVVAETHAYYHHPARLDDLLTITTNLCEIGRTSMQIEQKALSISEQNGMIILCSGVIRIAWVDAVALKPARIPKIILEALK